MTTQIAQSSRAQANSCDEIADSANEPLTPTEQEHLTLCESTIATGWQTFVEVGLALSTIREERLYTARSILPSSSIVGQNGSFTAHTHID